MDTRKITLIATIAVIALIAVGVGYAYTASTQNSTNSASGEYVTLTQAQTAGAADGSYKFANGAKVYFDTVNTATETTYSLSGIKDTTTFAGYTVVQVGNPFDLVATQKNGAWPALTVKMSTTNFTALDGWNFFVKVTTNGNDTKYISTGDNTWNDVVFKIVKDTGEAYKRATVTVYFGYPNGIVPTTVPGGAEATILSGASIKFTAYNELINNPALTVTFDPTSPATTGTHLEDVDVTVMHNATELEEGTDYTLTWRDSTGAAITNLSTTGAGTYTLEIMGINNYTGAFKLETYVVNA